MKKTRKLVSLLCAAVMVLAGAAPAGAAEYLENAQVPSIEVFSPEFPDAYIEYGALSANVTYSATNDTSPIATVEITVFCEEMYDAETGLMLYSRLMNKQEVEAWRAEGASTDPVLLNLGIDFSQAYQTKGALTLNLDILSGAPESSRYRTNYFVRGDATWNQGPLFESGSTRPSWGDDIIALNWGHNLASFETHANGTDNKGESIDVTLCSHSSNQYLAWQFEDQRGTHLGPIGGLDWAQNVHCDTMLGVPDASFSQTETTAVVLKYAHTYATIQPDKFEVAFSFSTEKIGGELSISFSEGWKSWEIIALANSIPLC